MSYAVYAEWITGMTDALRGVIHARRMTTRETGLCAKRSLPLEALRAKMTYLQCALNATFVNYRGVILWGASGGMQRGAVNAAVSRRNVV